MKEGKFVLDPFVGTGSLLIAAAQFKGKIQLFLFQGNFMRFKH